MGFPGSLTWCNSSLRIGEKLHHLLMVYAFYFLATIFLLPLDKTREIMAKLESLKQLEGKPKYGFVAAFFDRIYVNSCIKFPFKWFFSTYNTFSNMMLGMKITRTAFKRLFLVTIKPDGEDTAGYEAFNDELKKRSSQKPFYSDAYQGCLRIFGGKCFMNKTSFKVTKSRFCACTFTSYIRRPYSAYNGNNPILSYPLLSYSIIISYPILPYPILSFPILSYSIISYPILPSPVVFYHHILSFPLLSYSILSYPILPYLVVLYHIMFFSPILFILPIHCDTFLPRYKQIQFIVLFQDIFLIYFCMHYCIV